MNEQETIVDIIAEMCGARTEFPFVYLMGEPDTPEVLDFRTREITEPRKINIRRVTVKELADRLEAAHKREIDELKKQIGNAAKLREALEYMFILIDGRNLVLECETTEEISGVQGKLAEARAALAAPPRNCDNLKTSWEVLKEWHEGLDTAHDIVRLLDWLLAPATEKEGGDK